MNYLIHSGLLLALCYLYYRLVLRRETHFRLNRIVLLGSLVACLLLPLVTVPAGLSLATAPAARVTAAPIATRHVEVVAPIESKVTARSNPTVAPVSGSASIRSDGTGMDWPRMIWYGYLGGVVVFGLHFLIQLLVLLRRIAGNPVRESDGMRIVELSADLTPHSFWNYVFLNPGSYDPETYRSILSHERIHVTQRHSVDLLLAELLLVVQWCNPFAWLYRRAIENNLEYLTDAEILHGGTDPVSYQLSLLQVAVPGQAHGLVTHFNQNFLEQRIMMMKAKKSTSRSGWKYLALPALLLVSLSWLNPVAAQEPMRRSSSPLPAPQVPVAPPPAPAPPPLPPPAPVSPPLPPLPPAMRTEMSTGQTGKLRRSWTAEIEGNEVCMAFIESGERGNSYQMNTTHCFPTAGLGNLPRGSMGDFSLTREAGTLNLRGIFEDNTGLGTYEFVPSAAFVAALDQTGFGTFEDRELTHFFLTDITRDYLTYLRKEFGPSHDELVQVAIFGIDRATLTQVTTDLREAGFAAPKLETIVQLRIFGIDKGYIDGLATAGFKNLALDDVIQAKIHGLDADFVREMNSLGYKDLAFDQVIQLAIHGIDAEYAREMASLGYDDLSAQDIVGAKIHGVNARKIRELREAGLTNLTLDEAVQASIHGVDKEYTAELASLGLKDLSLEDVVSAKIHGVTPELVAGLRDLGYTELGVRDFIDARIHGVTPEFVTSYADLGYGKIPFRTLIDLRIHAVSPQFISENRREGDTLRDLIDYKIMRHARR